MSEVSALAESVIASPAQIAASCQRRGARAGHPEQLGAEKEAWGAGGQRPGIRLIARCPGTPLLQLWMMLVVRRELRDDAGSGAVMRRFCHVIRCCSTCAGLCDLPSVRKLCTASILHDRQGEFRSSQNHAVRLCSGGLTPRKLRQRIAMPGSESRVNGLVDRPYSSVVGPSSGKSAGVNTLKSADDSVRLQVASGCARQKARGYG